MIINNNIVFITEMVKSHLLELLKKPLLLLSLQYLFIIFIINIYCWWTWSFFSFTDNLMYLFNIC